MLEDDKDEGSKDGTAGDEQARADGQSSASSMSERREENGEAPTQGKAGKRRCFLKHPEAESEPETAHDGTEVKLAPSRGHNRVHADVGKRANGGVESSKVNMTKRTVFIHFHKAGGTTVKIPAVLNGSNDALDSRNHAPIQAHPLLYTYRIVLKRRVVSGIVIDLFIPSMQKLHPVAGAFRRGQALVTWLSIAPEYARDICFVGKETGALDIVVNGRTSCG